MTSDTAQAGVAFLYVRTPEGADVDGRTESAEAQEEQVVVLNVLLVGENTTWSVAFRRGDFNRLLAAPNQIPVEPVKVAICMEKSK